jgi:hypothetical protein
MKALIAASIVSVAFSLAGCQLGDYTAPNDGECAKAAAETLHWLSAQPLISDAALVEAKAELSSDGCAATFEATVPDDTSRSQFIPLATGIVAHLPDASTTDSNLVDLKHGEQTTHLDRSSDPSEVPWSDYR